MTACPVREVVTLRPLLGPDTEPTARIPGIAQGTVGAHLHNAVATMRTAILSPGSQEIIR